MSREGRFRLPELEPIAQALTKPDGRYIVVHGRLWRASNPGLRDGRRQELVSDLMTARRDVGRAMKSGDVERVRDARQRVDEAKTALGERGSVWWTDGAPDLNRHLVRNTAYADWYAGLDCSVDS